MLKNVFPGINKEYWFLFEQKIFIFRDLREIPKNAINIDIILESMEKLSQFRGPFNNFECHKMAVFG